MQAIVRSSPPSLPPTISGAAPAESSGGRDAFEKVMNRTSDRDISKGTVQEIPADVVAEQPLKADSETIPALPLSEEPADDAEARLLEELPLPVPTIWTLISAPSPADLSVDAAGPVDEAAGSPVHGFSSSIINSKETLVSDALWDQAARKAAMTSAGSPMAADSPADLVARSAIAAPPPVQAQIAASVPVAKANAAEGSAVAISIAGDSTEISVKEVPTQIRSAPAAFPEAAADPASLPAYRALNTSVSDTEQPQGQVSDRAAVLAAVVDVTELLASNSGPGDVPAPLIPRAEPSIPALPAATLAHARVSTPNAAMPLPPGIGADMAAVVARQPDGPVEIRLSPEELGRLTMSLRTEGDILRITVQVERPDTLDLLRRNSDVLIQELRTAGFAGASLSFSTWGGSAHGDGGETGSGPAPSRPTEVSPVPAPSVQPALKQGLDIRL